MTRYPNEQFAFNRRQAQAYRGYLITPASGQFTISKDGYHISWAPDVDNAKRTIDELA